MLGLNSRDAYDRASLLISGFRLPEEQVEEKGSNPEKIIKIYEYAGLTKEENIKNIYALGGCSAILLGIFIATKNIFFLISIGVLLFFARAVLYKKIKNRSLKFEQDFATFLIALASSLRCGHDPLTAFINSRDLFCESTPLHQTILESKIKLETGDNETKVIRSFAENIQHPDLGLFRSAFILSRKEGSSLAKCLQRIASVVRSRQSFRRKIKAAVAMQKLSAIGILCGVVGMFLIQFFSAKKGLLDAFSHPLGFKLLIVSAVLILTGLLWMYKVTNQSFDD